jgi:hypothetical protein
MMHMSIRPYYLALLVWVSLFVPLAAQAAAPSATLSLARTEGQGSIPVGQDFTVAVTVNSPTQALSIVQAGIKLPANVGYVSDTASGSVFNTVVKAPAVKDGVLQLTRARFDTGYIGTGGLVDTLTLKAEAPGSGSIQLVDGQSQTLAYADSTNVLQSTSGSVGVNATGITANQQREWLGLALAVIVLLVGGFFVLRRRR